MSTARTAPSEHTPSHEEQGANNASEEIWIDINMDEESSASNAPKQSKHGERLSRRTTDIEEARLPSTPKGVHERPVHKDERQRPDQWERTVPETVKPVTTEERRAHEQRRAEAEAFRAENERKRIELAGKEQEYEERREKLEHAKERAVRDLEHVGWWHRTFKTATYMEALGNVESAEARLDRLNGRWKATKEKLRVFEPTKELRSESTFEKTETNRTRAQSERGVGVKETAGKRKKSNGKARSPQREEESEMPVITGTPIPEDATVRGRTIPEEYMPTVGEAVKRSKEVFETVNALDKLEDEHPYALNEHFSKETLATMWKEYDLPRPMRLYADFNDPNSSIDKNEAAEGEWKKRRETAPTLKRKDVILEKFTLHDFIGGIHDRQTRLLKTAEELINRYELTQKLHRGNIGSRTEMEAILKSLDREAEELKRKADELQTTTEAFFRECQLVAEEKEKKAA